MRTPVRTLDAAKTYVKDHLEDGVECPCCGKYARSYWRKINKSMAAALAWLVDQSDGGKAWVDVPNDAPSWLIRTNQHPTLAWWGLVERKPNKDPKKKESGIWRPTAVGVQFVRGLTVVPAKAHTYNGVVLEYSRETISWTEAMGVDFDYSEIMRRGP